jgi:hypothetical protein
VTLFDAVRVVAYPMGADGFAEGTPLRLQRHAGTLDGSGGMYALLEEMGDPLAHMADVPLLARRGTVLFVLVRPHGAGPWNVFVRDDRGFRRYGRAAAEVGEIFSVAELIDALPKDARAAVRLLSKPMQETP